MIYLTPGANLKTGISYGICKASQYPLLEKEIKASTSFRHTPYFRNLGYEHHLQKGNERFVLAVPHTQNPTSMIIVLQSDTMVQTPMITKPTQDIYGMGWLFPQLPVDGLFVRDDVPPTWAYTPGPEWGVPKYKQKSPTCVVPKLKINFKHPIFEEYHNNNNTLLKG